MYQQLSFYSYLGTLKLTLDYRFEDCEIAKQIIKKADDADMGVDSNGEFTVKLTTNSARFGNWVKFNTVVVSWFRRSKKAIIECSDPTLLNCAKNILSKTKTPSGRTLRCKPFRASKDNIRRKEYTMEVENLDWDLTADWLQKIIEPALATMVLQDSGGELPREVPPLRSIRIMDPKYELDKHESGEVVQTLLKSIGPLESFDVHDENRSIKLKATAAFLSAHHASEVSEKFLAGKAAANMILGC